LTPLRSVRGSDGIYPVGTEFQAHLFCLLRSKLLTRLSLSAIRILSFRGRIDFRICSGLEIDRLRVGFRRAAAAVALSAQQLLISKLSYLPCRRMSIRRAREVFLDVPCANSLRTWKILFFKERGIAHESTVHGSARR
ncbi:MAG: hypothetical protein ACRELG_30325, partial [Gemmataceae bacterium]